jgi:hypothetical protein
MLSTISNMLGLKKRKKTGRGRREQTGPRRQPDHRLRPHGLPPEHRGHDGSTLLRNMVDKSGLSTKIGGRSHFRKLLCQTVYSSMNKSQLWRKLLRFNNNICHSLLTYSSVLSFVPISHPIP